MAINRQRMTMINYRFLAEDLEYTANHLQHLSQAASSAGNRDLELEESDVWSVAESEESSELGLRLQCRSPATMTKNKNKKEARTTEVAPVTAVVKPSSLPVNVPDWSKILRSEYKENRWRKEFYEYEEEDGGEEEEEEEEEVVENSERAAAAEGCGRRRRWLPPHELMQARSRTTASFSVHEGMGRTLKGRDLSRVRNAIWAKIGFLD